MAGLARKLLGTVILVLVVFFIVSGQRTVRFPDQNLEAAIREAIYKETGPILDFDLSWLSVFQASDRGIKDLAGIENCTSLTSVFLSGNSIRDLSLLASLSILSVAYLDRNEIKEGLSQDG